MSDPMFLSDPFVLISNLFKHLSLEQMTYKCAIRTSIPLIRARIAVLVCLACFGGRCCVLYHHNSVQFHDFKMMVGLEGRFLLHMFGFPIGWMWL